MRVSPRHAVSPRRGEGWVRAGVQVRAVVRVVRSLDRTNYSVQRAIPDMKDSLSDSVKIASILNRIHMWRSIAWTVIK